MNDDINLVDENIEVATSPPSSPPSLSPFLHPSTLFILITFLAPTLPPSLPPSLPPQRRVDEFVARVRELKKFYPGNNIMLQMGR